MSTQRGDTIIEVMLAFAVFAMIAVGALTVMNRGVASAQDALETTLVRAQMDNQVEMLRFLNRAYSDNPDSSMGKKYHDILAKTTDADASEFAAAGCIDAIPGAGPFFVESDGVVSTSVIPMSNASAPAFAQVVTSPTTSSYGLWIEAVKGEATNGAPGFVDFHVRACWEGLTSSVPRTLGTIVRLYDPAT